MQLFGIQLWGPDMDTPVEVWLIEEIPMPLSDPVYHKTQLLSTTWNQVYKWSAVPTGDYSTSNPIIVAKVEFRGRSVFNSYTKQEFDQEFGKIPTVSTGQRIRNLDDALALFQRAKEIFTSK